jgi:hypothetical protein
MPRLACEAEHRARAEQVQASAQRRFRRTWAKVICVDAVRDPARTFDAKRLGHEAEVTGNADHQISMRQRMEESGL